MFEGLRGYVQMAAGLGEVTAARAKEVAGSLLSGLEGAGLPGAPAGASAIPTQVAGLAEDLLTTAKANRGALVELVQKEAEQVVHRLGVVTAAEAEELRARVAALEAELATAKAAARPSGRAANATTATPAAKKTARKTATKTATKAPATTSATKAPARKAAKKLPPNAAPGSPDRG